MNLFVLIEIIGSVLYLLQKVFLSDEKRIGWLLGFLGAIAFTAVTLHKSSYAYAVLEITSGIVFLFGLYAWKKPGQLQKHATIAMSVLALVGIAVVFFLSLGSPNWIVEDLMVSLFAIGAMLLVLRNPVGWILYILGSIVLIYYGLIIGTYFIVILQLAYIPFAIKGFRSFSRSTNLTS